MVNSRALGLCLATFAWYASVAGEEVSFSPRDAELELLDSQGLLQASAQIKGNHCKCLEWSKVYGENGLAPTQCKHGFGSMVGAMFCSFTSKFHNNACLKEKLLDKSQSPPICMVSPKCATGFELTTSELGTITEYKAKRCVSGTDTILSELSVEESIQLANTTGTDQAYVQGFASVYYDEVAANLTDTELQDIKDTGVMTFVMSSNLTYEHEDRYSIKGNEVWVHKYHPEEADGWRVTCKSGCSSNAHVTEKGSAKPAKSAKKAK